MAPPLMSATITLVERAAQAVDILLREGLKAAQNRFHGEPAVEVE